MTLPELRTKIDGLDEQIIRLLNERADLVHEVGVIKKAEGASIYAPEREEQVFRGLVQKANDLRSRLPDRSIRAIYREIISASYALEKGLVIAYFGPEATNTHQAARSRFGASVEYAAQVTIADVFDAVSRGAADYGVVPIENSTEGAVNHTLDVFMESDLRICAQILMRIENHLAARVPKSAIGKLYSHPQVFGQCRNWLRSNLPHVDLIEVSSTPRAAELAAKEPDSGALVGAMAAEFYGLQLIESSIQDNPNNTTRFLVIAHRTSPRTGDDRTSLMFSLQDKPGALFSAIEPFKRLKINMSKIESRPSKRKAWEYFFFVDIDGHTDDAAVKDALAELETHCTFVKVLGTYPKSTPV
ncbi:MAG TPA: prephenate dehydratase [Chthoniobacteraceae bacterium]|nr:prephenate dehydratase [Chthoniobacteraceae bacterium]